VGSQNPQSQGPDHQTSPAPRILALWSAPRSRSTAFFRMMAERGDFAVVHEPFSYLAEFGETAVDGETVRTERDLIQGLRRMGGRAPVFFKDTTDERYPGLLADTRFLRDDAVHTFIIRHPRETIASYYAINPEVKLHQIGIEAQYEIFTAVEALTGRAPLVVDSAELVGDPAAVVATYCAQLGIPYRAEALNWQPGARDEWRPSARWHEAASTSSGFQGGSAIASRDRVDVDGDPKLRGYLEHHLPYYEALWERRMALDSAVGSAGETTAW
jgi:hypothetical protein